MAKSKSFFGLRRGSTKSQTYQVLNGQQITKDRVIDVKNPRTRSQMVQRMVMTTAGSAYRHMAEICDHAFEGVSYGQRSYSRFMSLNTKMLIDDIRGDEGQCSYNPFGDANLYPSPFIMSRGSLKFKDTFAGFYEESNNVFIQLPTLATSETRPSVAEQAAAWGLSLGDILTFPFIYQESGTGIWRFSFVRIRYNVASDSELNWETLSQCFTVSSAAEVNQALYVDNSFCLEVIVPGTADTEVYGCTILSRKSNNKWLRSNAAIVFPGATIHDPSWQEALATYPVGSDYILNGAAIKGSGGIKPGPESRLKAYQVEINSQSHQNVIYLILHGRPYILTQNDGLVVKADNQFIVSGDYGRQLGLPMIDGEINAETNEFVFGDEDLGLITLTLEDVALTDLSEDELINMMANYVQGVYRINDESELTNFVICRGSELNVISVNGHCPVLSSGDGIEFIDEFNEYTTYDNAQEAYIDSELISDIPTSAFKEELRLRLEAVTGITVSFGQDMPASVSTVENQIPYQSNIELT